MLRFIVESFDIDEPLMPVPLLPMFDEPVVDPWFMFDEPVPVVEPEFMLGDPVVLEGAISPLRDVPVWPGVPPLGPAAPGALLLGEPEAPPPLDCAVASPAPHANAKAAEMAMILDACLMCFS